MISRRNFFSISILMAMVLFLCMCLNTVKDGLNDYSVNRYTETAEDYPSRVSIYVPGGAEDAAKDGMPGDAPQDAYQRRRLAVCIGDMDSPAMQAAWAWAAYTKRSACGFQSLAEYQAAGDMAPEMLVVDAGHVDWGSEKDLGILEACLEDGTSLVFTSLPGTEAIKGSSRVRGLFGIKEVLADEADVAGLYLRKGFLLGGQTFYLEKADAGSGEWLPGSSAFPGTMSFPWCLPDAGTKAYMKGIPADGSLEAEQYPLVLWRNGHGGAYVFAVNGGLMDGMEGIGILSAISAEMHPYEIYPVLNAQNIILDGYPGLADENRAAVEASYSRPLKQVLQEIVWTGASNLLEGRGYRASCMMTPQYDYSDGSLPEEGQLAFYMKQFNEKAAEMGWSASSVSGTGLADKLAADGAFFDEALDGYSPVSAYFGGMDEGMLAGQFDAGLLGKARTAVTEAGSGAPEPFGFLTDDVTVQRVLGDGLEYTYRNDFLFKCMETALGYFSVSVDMSRAAYPQGEGDDWESLSSGLAVTVSTYGDMFPDFDRTTAAECDMRIRSFLAMDYTESRSGSDITLHIDGAGGTSWFILRTHNEAVTGMEGGTWTELEEGAYLVEAEGPDVTVSLGPADERLYD